jgi:deoxyguanosine kinase
MLPERCRHIAVEGPIGVGKTSLARKLASLPGAELLLENADENPFLARFYEDRRSNALPAQLFFLLARVEQIRQLGQGERASPITIADYLLDKDPLFAKLNLDDAEYRLYLKPRTSSSTCRPRPPP